MKLWLCSHAKHNQYQNDDKQWCCYGFIITVEYMMMYRSLNVASSLASRHLLQLDHACLVINHRIMFDGVFIFFIFLAIQLPDYHMVRFVIIMSFSTSVLSFFKSASNIQLAWLVKPMLHLTDYRYWNEKKKKKKT
jgi:hypothetical protein